MDGVEGAQTFHASGSAYDRFMGRYSMPLARRFADAAGVAAGQRVLDVGCGPGALTTVLADRLGRWLRASGTSPGRFGKPAEIVELFGAAGLVDLVESSLGVSALYTGFEDLWTGFMEGIGPAGSYAVALPDDHRQRLRAEMERRLDVGTGPFELTAAARCAVGRVPR